MTDTRNPVSERVYPDTASPRLVEYARRAASQVDMREAIRLQSLANEMRSTFENWPLPLRDQLTLSWVIGTVESRAVKLMEAKS